MGTCCFIGHRNFEMSVNQKQQLTDVICELIADGVDTFLFGSRSKFDDECHKIVTDLMKDSTNVKRVYVRAEYKYISETYEKGLLARFESTIYPDEICNSGKSVYVERNQYMIDKSDVCIFAYDENYTTPLKQRSKYLSVKTGKSGTAIAYKYAVQKNKRIVNVMAY